MRRESGYMGLEKGFRWGLIAWGGRGSACRFGSEHRVGLESGRGFMG